MSVGWQAQAENWGLEASTYGPSQDMKDLMLSLASLELPNVHVLRIQPTYSRTGGPLPVTVIPHDDCFPGHGTETKEADRSSCS